MLSSDALVEAAQSFSQQPKRFELLDGGVTTHVCRSGHRINARRAANDDCGKSFNTVLALALKDAFPQAEIVHVSGTADDDFVRMASSPMLVVGGGSYALFAALSSSGEV